jgi:hypothetical protein
VATFSVPPSSFLPGRAAVLSRHKGQRRCRAPTARAGGYQEDGYPTGSRRQTVTSTAPATSTRLIADRISPDGSPGNRASTRSPANAPKGEITKRTQKVRTRDFRKRLQGKSLQNTSFRLPPGQGTDRTQLQHRKPPPPRPALRRAGLHSALILPPSSFAFSPHPRVSASPCLLPAVRSVAPARARIPSAPRPPELPWPHVEDSR